MSKFSIPEHHKQRPVVHMAPLIDIVFLTLVFFMTLSIFNQQETQINISVPKAKDAKETTRNAGEIIINVEKNGSIIVNQKQLNPEGLASMLKRVATLFPNQSVIVRADKDTSHKFVIAVLDACAQADIWNISFATMKDQN